MIKNTILVVEDDLQSREGLRGWLVSQGYSVRTAFDCPEALRCIKARRFDMAIIDIHMPDTFQLGLDGWDVAKIFRAYYPSSAVIIVSAEEVVPGKVDQIGVGGFLKKPIELVQLRSMLDKLLN